MKRDRERLGRTFDRSAELYHEVRPGYPAALFDDVVSLSGIPLGGQVLEIGCGTGKATLPLARRGYRILCLEPGASLAAVSRRNLTAFPRVEVRDCSFEGWALAPGAFDLVVAATSFGWVDPTVRYWKTAAALRPGRCIALFWNAHVQLPGQDHFFEAVQEVYRRHTPEMVGRPLYMSELPTSVEREFIASDLFEQVVVKHYPWTETYDTDRYLKLLQTFSGHIALPEATRRALLDDIAALIAREFGGQVVKHHVAVLQVARRRECQCLPTVSSSARG
jgi:SAM-dependent methyltransferase